MFRELAGAFALALLMVGCGMNGPYTGGTHPAATDPIAPGDSAAVVAILNANGLSDTLMRHIVTVRDTRVVVLSLVKTDYTYDYLPANSIAVIPQSIGMLTALETLWVADQAIVALPDSLCGLPALVHLEVVRCPIEGLPSNLPSCTTLTGLTIARCGLDAMPSVICQIPKLKYLSLNDNILTSIPDCIGNLTGLERLYLDRNNLCSLPPSVTLLRNFKKYRGVSFAYYFDISGNGLSLQDSAVNEWASTYQPGWENAQDSVKVLQCQ